MQDHQEQPQAESILDILFRLSKMADESGSAAASKSTKNCVVSAESRREPFQRQTDKCTSPKRGPPKGRADLELELKTGLKDKLSVNEEDIVPSHSMPPLSAAHSKVKVSAEESDSEDIPSFPSLDDDSLLSDFLFEDEIKNVSHGAEHGDESNMKALPQYYTPKDRCQRSRTDSSPEPDRSRLCFSRMSRKCKKPSQTKACSKEQIDGFTSLRRHVCGEEGKDNRQSLTLSRSFSLHNASEESGTKEENYPSEVRLKLFNIESGTLTLGTSSQYDLLESDEFRTAATQEGSRKSASVSACCPGLSGHLCGANLVQLLKCKFKITRKYEKGERYVLTEPQAGNAYLMRWIQFLKLSAVTSRALHRWTKEPPQRIPGFMREKLWFAVNAKYLRLPLSVNMLHKRNAHNNKGDIASHHRLLSHIIQYMDVLSLYPDLVRHDAKSLRMSRTIRRRRRPGVRKALSASERTWFTRRGAMEQGMKKSARYFLKRCHYCYSDVVKDCMSSVTPCRDDVIPMIMIDRTESGFQNQELDHFQADGRKNDGKIRKLQPQNSSTRNGNEYYIDPLQYSRNHPQSRRCGEKNFNGQNSFLGVTRIGEKNSNWSPRPAHNSDSDLCVALSSSSSRTSLSSRSDRSASPRPIPCTLVRGLCEPLAWSGQHEQEPPTSTSHRNLMRLEAGAGSAQVPPIHFYKRPSPLDPASLLSTRQGLLYAGLPRLIRENCCQNDPRLQVARRDKEGTRKESSKCDNPASVSDIICRCPPESRYPKGHNKSDESDPCVEDADSVRRCLIATKSGIYDNVVPLKNTKNFASIVADKTHSDHMLVACPCHTDNDQSAPEAQVTFNDAPYPQVQQESDAHNTFPLARIAMVLEEEPHEETVTDSAERPLSAAGKEKTSRKPSLPTSSTLSICHGLGPFRLSHPDVASRLTKQHTLDILDELCAVVRPLSPLHLQEGDGDNDRTAVASAPMPVGTDNGTENVGESVKLKAGNTSLFTTSVSEASSTNATLSLGNTQLDLLTSCGTVQRMKRLGACSVSVPCAGAIQYEVCGLTVVQLFGTPHDLQLRPTPEEIPPKTEDFNDSTPSPKPSSIDNVSTVVSNAGQEKSGYLEVVNISHSNKEPILSTQKLIVQPKLQLHESLLDKKARQDCRDIDLNKQGCCHFEHISEAVLPSAPMKDLIFQEMPIQGLDLTIAAEETVGESEAIQEAHLTSHDRSEQATAEEERIQYESRDRHSVDLFGGEVVLHHSEKNEGNTSSPLLIGKFGAYNLVNQRKRAIPSSDITNETNVLAIPIKRVCDMSHKLVVDANNHHGGESEESQTVPYTGQSQQVQNEVSDVDIPNGLDYVCDDMSTPIVLSASDRVYHVSQIVPHQFTSMGVPKDHDDHTFCQLTHPSHEASQSPDQVFDTHSPDEQIYHTCDLLENSSVDEHDRKEDLLSQAMHTAGLTESAIRAFLRSDLTIETFLVTHSSSVVLGAVSEPGTSNIEPPENELLSSIFEPFSCSSADQINQGQLSVLHTVGDPLNHLRGGGAGPRIRLDTCSRAAVSPEARTFNLRAPSGTFRCEGYSKSELGAAEETLPLTAARREYSVQHDSHSYPHIYFQSFKERRNARIDDEDGLSCCSSSFNTNANEGQGCAAQLDFLKNVSLLEPYTIQNQSRIQYSSVNHSVKDLFGDHSSLEFTTKMNVPTDMSDSEQAPKIETFSERSDRHTSSQALSDCAENLDGTLMSHPCTGQLYQEDIEVLDLLPLPAFLEDTSQEMEEEEDEDAEKEVTKKEERKEESHGARDLSQRDLKADIIRAENYLDLRETRHEAITGKCIKPMIRTRLSPRRRRELIRACVEKEALPYVRKSLPPRRVRSVTVASEDASAERPTAKQCELFRARNIVRVGDDDTSSQDRLVERRSGAGHSKAGNMPTSSKRHCCRGFASKRSLSVSVTEERCLRSRATRRTSTEDGCKSFCGKLKLEGNDTLNLRRLKSRKYGSKSQSDSEEELKSESVASPKKINRRMLNIQHSSQSLNQECSREHSGEHAQKEICAAEAFTQQLNLFSPGFLKRKGRRCNQTLSRLNTVDKINTKVRRPLTEAKRRVGGAIAAVAVTSRLRVRRSAFTSDRRSSFTYHDNKNYGKIDNKSMNLRDNNNNSVVVCDKEMFIGDTGDETCRSLKECNVEMIGTFQGERRILNGQHGTRDVIDAYNGVEYGPTPRKKDFTISHYPCHHPSILRGGNKKLGRKGLFARAKSWEGKQRLVYMKTDHNVVSFIKHYKGNFMRKSKDVEYNVASINRREIRYIATIVRVMCVQINTTTVERDTTNLKACNEKTNRRNGNDTMSIARTDKRGRTMCTCHLPQCLRLGNSLRRFVLGPPQSYRKARRRHRHSDNDYTDISGSNVHNNDTGSAYVKNINNNNTDDDPLEEVEKQNKPRSDQNETVNVAQPASSTSDHWRREVFLTRELPRIGRNMENFNEARRRLREINSRLTKIHGKGDLSTRPAPPTRSRYSCGGVDSVGGCGRISGVASRSIRGRGSLQGKKATDDFSNGPVVAGLKGRVHDYIREGVKPLLYAKLRDAQSHAFKSKTTVGGKDRKSPTKIMKAGSKDEGSCSGKSKINMGDFYKLDKNSDMTKICCAFPTKKTKGGQGNGNNSSKKPISALAGEANPKRMPRTSVVPELSRGEERGSNMSTVKGLDPSLARFVERLNTGYGQQLTRGDAQSQARLNQLCSRFMETANARRRLEQKLLERRDQVYNRGDVRAALLDDSGEGTPEELQKGLAGTNRIVEQDKLNLGDRYNAFESATGRDFAHGSVTDISSKVLNHNENMGESFTRSPLSVRKKRNHASPLRPTTEDTIGHDRAVSIERRRTSISPQRGPSYGKVAGRSSSATRGRPESTVTISIDSRGQSPRIRSAVQLRPELQESVDRLSTRSNIPLARLEHDINMWEASFGKSFALTTAQSPGGNINTAPTPASLTKANTSSSNISMSPQQLRSRRSFPVPIGRLPRLKKPGVSSSVEEHPMDRRKEETQNEVSAENQAGSDIPHLTVSRQEKIDTFFGSLLSLIEKRQGEGSNRCQEMCARSRPESAPSAKAVVNRAVRSTVTSSYRRILDNVRAKRSSSTMDWEDNLEIPPLSEFKDMMESPEALLSLPRLMPGQQSKTLKHPNLVIKKEGDEVPEGCHSGESKDDSHSRLLKPEESERNTKTPCETGGFMEKPNAVSDVSPKLTLNSTNQADMDMPIITSPTKEPSHRAVGLLKHETVSDENSLPCGHAEVTEENDEKPTILPLGLKQDFLESGDISATAVAEVGVSDASDNGSGDRGDDPDAFLTDKPRVKEMQGRPLTVRFSMYQGSDLVGDQAETNILTETADFGSTNQQQHSFDKKGTTSICTNSTADINFHVAKSPGASSSTSHIPPVNQSPPKTRIEDYGDDGPDEQPSDSLDSLLTETLSLGIKGQEEKGQVKMEHDDFGDSQHSLRYKHVQDTANYGFVDSYKTHGPFGSSRSDSIDTGFRYDRFDIRDNFDEQDGDPLLDDHLHGSEGRRRESTSKWRPNRRDSIFGGYKGPFDIEPLDTLERRAELDFGSVYKTTRLLGSPSEKDFDSAATELPAHENLGRASPTHIGSISSKSSPDRSKRRATERPYGASSPTRTPMAKNVYASARDRLDDPDLGSHGAGPSMDLSRSRGAPTMYSDPGGFKSQANSSIELHRHGSLSNMPDHRVGVPGTYGSTRGTPSRDYDSRLSTDIAWDQLALASPYYQDAPVSFYSQLPAASTYNSLPKASTYSHLATSSTYNQLPTTSTYNPLPTTSTYNQLPTTSTYSHLTTTSSYNQLATASTYEQLAMASTYSPLATTSTYNQLTTVSNYNQLPTASSYNQAAMSMSSLESMKRGLGFSALTPIQEESEEEQH